MKEVSQIKPRLGQSRAGLRRKITTPISTPINKPIADLTKRHVPNAQPVAQPKLTSKIAPIPDYAIPQMKHRGDTSSRKPIEGTSTEIPIYPDPTYRPPPLTNKITYIRSS